MWSKIKNSLLPIGSALLLLLGFKMGSKSKQAKHNEASLKAIKKAQEKAKEADDAANKAKATINVHNVVDQLNKL